MKAPEITAICLNHITEKAFELAVEEISLKKMNGYPAFELLVVKEALETASELPGHEYEVWQTMSDSIDGMNAALKRDGHPALSCISFKEFAGLLAKSLGRSSLAAVVRLQRQ